MDMGPCPKVHSLQLRKEYPFATMVLTNFTFLLSLKCLICLILFTVRAMHSVIPVFGHSIRFYFLFFFIFVVYYYYFLMWWDVREIMGISPIGKLLSQLLEKQTASNTGLHFYPIHSWRFEFRTSCSFPKGTASRL